MRFMLIISLVCITIFAVSEAQTHRFNVTRRGQAKFRQQVTSQNPISLSTTISTPVVSSTRRNISRGRGYSRNQNSILLTTTTSIPIVNSTTRNDSQGRVYNQNGNSGRYSGNTNGRYNSRNAGRYNPINTGRYNPSNDGRYVPDSAGTYTGSAIAYVHQNIGGGQYSGNADKYQPYKDKQYQGGNYNPDRRPYQPYKDKQIPGGNYNPDQRPYQAYKDKQYPSGDIQPYQPFTETKDSSGTTKNPSADTSNQYPEKNLNIDLQPLEDSKDASKSKNNESIANSNQYASANNNSSVTPESPLNNPQTRSLDQIYELNIEILLPPKISKKIGSTDTPDVNDSNLKSRTNPKSARHQQEIARISEKILSSTNRPNGLRNGASVGGQHLATVDVGPIVKSTGARHGDVAVGKHIDGTERQNNGPGTYSSGVGHNDAGFGPDSRSFNSPINNPRNNFAGNYRIIVDNKEMEDSGNYHYNYQTENKIYGEERSEIVSSNQNEDKMSRTGYYKYTGPDGVEYTVNYHAGPEGFVPDAAHIPTPPPIPDLILRSLRYQESVLASKKEINKKN